jgi:OOP family OmpA-OmpF porin
MNNISTRRRRLLLVAAMVLGTPATQASAQSGHVPDQEREEGTAVVVRNGTGLCWHTSVWTPVPGKLECDGLSDTVASTATPVPGRVATAPVAVARASNVAPPDNPPPEVARDYIAAETATPVMMASVALSAIDKIILPTYTLFDNGKSVIKPAGGKTLDELAGKLRDDLRVVLSVGFTSTPGSNAYNMALSIRRSNAVKAYLVSRGIDARRIHGSGQGENHPIAANTTSAGRAENRRVEIEVLATSQKY